MISKPVSCKNGGKGHTEFSLQCGVRGPLYGVTDNYGNEGHNRFNYLMSKWVYKLTNKNVNRNGFTN